MKRSVYIIVFLVMSIQVFSQDTIPSLVVQQITPDSVDLAYYSKKRPLLAGAQIFGFNMAVWGFNRMSKKDFAYISINTMRANFKKGFVWDNDQMGTNMFLHPYHGSLYFNAARSNGYNYWQSGGFALAGSAMWEFFMENEYPSANDIIATPIGGMALGEMLYRSSDMILDDRAVGTERFGRELAGFIVSPTRGLTRIITGDAWHKRPTSGKQFRKPDIKIETSFGTRALELKNPVIDKGVGLVANLNIEYGDRFNTGGEKPFDYFTLKSSLYFQKSQPLFGQLNLIGRLWVTDLVDSPKNFLSLGFYQHMDYYDSDTISNISSKIPYRFAAPASLGIGFIYERKQLKKHKFDAFLHLNAVLLGASLSDYYKVDNRNYNLANGYSLKAGLNFAYKDKFKYSLSYETFGLYTWKGYPENINLEGIDKHEVNYQGDRSHSILHAISPRIDIKLRKRLYLTLMSYTYSRDTRYKYYDKVYSLTTEGRIMLSYNFD